VSGGTAPYVFSISGGNLPPGLSLNQATGTISGTPTAGGTYSFTAKVVDASGSVCDCNKQATVTCSIVITSNCPPIMLGCVSTGTGTVGTTYLGSFSVNGGVAPFTFSIVSGALPGGLSLNTATGVISGTPTTAGTYTFTAKVKGANSLTCGCYGYDTVCCSIKISPSICPPPTCSSLVAGDTATIGYWNGPNGQALINSLNGGPSSTQLGRWLANEFPYLFGANAGSDNLAGKSNSQVAYKFRNLFQMKGQKFMAQTLASALAVYVTDSDLAGNIAVASGFNVSTAGTGTKCYNVGSSGSTAGLCNNKNYTVMALLKQANLKKKQGCFSATAFNSIFDGINRKGDRL
jgi:hypothetical protein